METATRPIKLVYLTPALYMAGGVERVLTMKANYFAEHFGYDITIIVTEGKGKPLFYPLSPRITLINLDINFEQLWTCSFLKKIFVYLHKQRLYKQKVTELLMRLRPDVTISLLRREINFITSIQDGSKKMGELHVNRAHYRNFERDGFNPIKSVFAWFWMRSLVRKVKRLDTLVVLTETDRRAWPELKHVEAIPNPLFETPSPPNVPSEKRVILVGRYSYEKGIDMLLTAWSMVQRACPDWRLEIFGDGDSTPYDNMLYDLKIDLRRCILNGRTSNVLLEYARSQLAVCSSRFEGFGMVIIEEMACGLPVVSFDCPWGPRSIISDGEDGLLIENGNIIKLAAGLIRLMRDDSLRQQMSRAAKGNTPWFKLEYIAEMWKGLFERIVNQEHQTPEATTS